MPGGIALALLPWLALTAAADGTGYAYSVSVDAQPLDAALQEFARETGAELLYDRKLVDGLRSAKVRERLPIDIALRKLLRGSGLTARRSATGAWLIEASAASETASPDLPLPDILVVGTRTQNVDIRRRENDVQPHQVTGGEELVRAHRDDLGDYFRSRVTPSTGAAVTSDLLVGLSPASTQSSIDLRGLGPDATLILVDGRRLPDLANPVLKYIQADLNGIPLEAVDRVETMGGTAGGIYGFGGLGGAVNVVLKREYRGVELDTTTEITSRGDGLLHRLYARLGFTPDDGRTDVMLSASISDSRSILAGDRDDTARNRRITYGISPDLFVDTVQSWIAQNSISMVNLFGGPLTFKPEFGGASLGSYYTYLPAGFGGGASALVSTLAANAGSVDQTLSPGEARSAITPRASTASAILSVRHHFGAKAEIYLDTLLMRNDGKMVSHISSGSLLLFPDAPNNPFDQYVWLNFPVPVNTWTREARSSASRLIAGVIVGLPGQWKATGEMILGSEEFTTINRQTAQYSSPGIFDMGQDGKPALNPFGDWVTFQKAAQAYTFAWGIEQTGRNRYREQSVRLAGPLVTLSGGEAAVSLLAERRTETVPDIRIVSSNQMTDGGNPVATTSPGSDRETQSLYGEINAPVFGARAPFPLRDLQIQLAVRYDSMRYGFTAVDQSNQQAYPRPRFSGVAYTVGAKFSPTRWLLVRGSYSTGARPPAITDLIPTYLSLSYLTDPKRMSGEIFGPDIPVAEGGSLKLRTVRAGTVSVGIVVNPLGDHGPRVSLDYSRIRKTRDVVMFDPQEVLDHEELWPQRVRRLPLTDADRALGYSAGAIVMLDATAGNVGITRVDTLDGKFDWKLPALGGKLHWYGVGTLDFVNEQRGLLGLVTDRLAYLGGPLRFRANAGVEWSFGPNSLGANVQYFGRYRPYDYESAVLSGRYIAIQGSGWVRPQVFVDLDMSRRIRIGTANTARWLQLRVGVVNVLDQAPARASDFVGLGPGTSTFADPRRRRFEVSLRTQL